MNNKRQKRDQFLCCAKESSTSGYVYKLDDNNYQGRASKIINTEHYEDSKVLLDKADVVTVVKIIKSRPVKVSGVVFTDYDVDIQRILKNSRNYDLVDMEIRLIGGKTQTNQVNIPETPILEVGEIYLFAGNKTYSKNDIKKNLRLKGVSGSFCTGNNKRVYKRSTRVCDSTNESIQRYREKYDWK